MFCYPWDDLRKIFRGFQRMANLPNAVEILPKITTAWVGCTSVTDRQTDSEREREFAFAKNRRWLARLDILLSTQVRSNVIDCAVGAKRDEWRRELTKQQMNIVGINVLQLCWKLLFPTGLDDVSVCYARCWRLHCQVCVIYGLWRRLAAAGAGGVTQVIGIHRNDLKFSPYRPYIAATGGVAHRSRIRILRFFFHF